MTDTPTRWFAHGAYEVPAEARVVGDLLHFEADDWFPSRRLGSDVLPHFVRLTADRPQRLSLFVERFGLLGICEHGRPARHRLARAATAHLGSCALTTARKGSEPTSVWYGLARDARDVLGRASAASTEDERRLLAADIARWLTLGDVRPFLDTTAPGVLVRYSGAGMVGAVAIEMLLAVTRGRWMATCDGCTAVFFPARRPTPGRRTYCPECGVKAARRDASREYRRLNGDRIRETDRERKRLARPRASRPTTLDH